jgi:hypothetical protein
MDWCRLHKIPHYKNSTQPENALFVHYQVQ